MLVAKILVGENKSQTNRTSQLAFLTEEQNIACFDLIGELIKSNKRCMAMFEIQLGSHNLNRILSLACKNMIDGNVFFRTIMISIIYFYDETKDMKFI